MEIKTPNVPAAKEPAAMTKKKAASAKDYLVSDSFKSQLQMALPKFFDADRFVRSALSEFRLNPALQECSVPSVLGYYMQAAMCGLEPSSVLGQCYPVPFNNKKTGQKECQFMLGYRGMASLARRSGDVLSIDAHVVHAKDDFQLTYGLHQDLHHVPDLGDDPGPMTGVYCVVTFKDGSTQFSYMTKSQVDKIRRRSKTSGSGPWVTDYEEMAKKTVFRQVFKWLPISIEAGTATASDENVVNYRPAPDAESPEESLEIDFVAAQPEEEADNADV